MCSVVRLGRPASARALITLYSIPPVILLDNLDAVLINRSRYRGGSDVTRSYHQGKQASLVPLLEGAAIESGWDASSTLIFVVGHLPTLGTAPVRPESFIDCGLVESLAEYMADAVQIRLWPMDHTSVLRLLEIRRQEHEARAQASGIPLIIAPESVSFLGRSLMSNGSEDGLRTGYGRLQQAALAAIARWLQDGKDSDPIVVGPDDFPVSAPHQGRWLD